MNFSSYHGADRVKAIQYYWPATDRPLAEKALAELDGVDWGYIENDAERDYQRAVFVWKLLGKPKS